MEQNILSVIESSTTCLICNAFKLHPDFVTICGGTILHRSCANNFFKSKPTKNLYNQPLTHKTLDPCIAVNKLFLFGLTYTTMYDEEIKQLTRDENITSNTDAIIKLIIDIPKLLQLIPPSLSKNAQSNHLQ